VLAGFMAELARVGRAETEYGRSIPAKTVDV
jgi:hypothetical protein